MKKLVSLLMDYRLTDLCRSMHQYIFAYPLLFHPQLKIHFSREVVLESSIMGTLIEQRLLGLQFQKVKVFPLQQTEILKQDDLVYGVGYLLLKIKRLLFP